MALAFFAPSGEGTFPRRPRRYYPAGGTTIRIGAIGSFRDRASTFIPITLARSMIRSPDRLSARLWVVILRRCGCRAEGLEGLISPRYSNGLGTRERETGSLNYRAVRRGNRYPFIFLSQFGKMAVTAQKAARIYSRSGQFDRRIENPRSVTFVPRTCVQGGSEIFLSHSAGVDRLRSSRLEQSCRAVGRNSQ